MATSVLVVKEADGEVSIDGTLYAVMKLAGVGSLVQNPVVVVARRLSTFEVDSQLRPRLCSSALQSASHRMPPRMNRNEIIAALRIPRLVVAVMTRACTKSAVFLEVTEAFREVPVRLDDARAAFIACVTRIAAILMADVECCVHCLSKHITYRFISHEPCARPLACPRMCTMSSEGSHEIVEVKDV